MEQATKCLGYQQIVAASTTSAVGLTIPTDPVSGAPATFALIQAEAQAARWRDDGVNPTTTVGMNLVAGVVFEYRGLLDRIRFINATAGTIINVAYYR